MRGDARGRRIAVVPDRVVNPPRGEPDPLTSLAADGWGVIALSPMEAGRSARAVSVEIVVEQVIALLDDDYDVAVVDSDDPAIQEFVSALAETGRVVTRVLGPSER